MSTDNQKKNPMVSMLANKQQPLATPIPPSLQAKMAAMANRGAQPSLGNNLNPLHPALRPANSSPVPTRANLASPAGLGGRRMKPGFSLRDIAGADLTGAPAAGGGGLSGAGLGVGRPNEENPRRPAAAFGSPFSNFSKIVDPSGALNFSGKAVVHSTGVNFSSGASFAINMSQLQLSEELGKGNYGTVKKVLHTPTNVVMAMKEIRLELEPSKLQSILMELDVLHRAVAPNIVEFYGAFFIESCVYYCMEYMDAGSLDKLTGRRSPFAPIVNPSNPIPGMDKLTVNDSSSTTDLKPGSIWKPVPEDVLARIASSMVKGLAYLKDSLNVIHRDVKPTNVLISRKGAVKLCDFGVSGQLEKSLAKTNIGCQSYMAPERIKGESIHAESTYTVSSDVWSLGLSIIEIGRGHYPYPPETYQNVFAQLTAIVHGDPPDLPPIGGNEIPGSPGDDPVGKDVGYSETARDWVASCLVKKPEGRATYANLLAHPWLVEDASREVDMPSWVERACAQRDALFSIGEAAVPHSV